MIHEIIRAVWISLNKNLYNDARDELHIVENIGNICPPWVTKTQMKTGTSGVHFTTYTSLIRSETKSTVFEWLQGSYNTIIIFDEAHMMKNSSTKCAKTAVELQRRLYNPKVVYSNRNCRK